MSITASKVQVRDGFTVGGVQGGANFLIKAIVVLEMQLQNKIETKYDSNMIVKLLSKTIE